MHRRGFVAAFSALAAPGCIGSFGDEDGMVTGDG